MHKREREFKLVFSNPECLYDEELAEASGFQKTHWNKLRREQFKDWCTDNGMDFEDWKKRAQTIADGASNKYQSDICAANWHPDGPRAYYDSKRTTMMRDMIDFTVANTDLTVTKTLLESQFALGDGRKVTWVKATKGEHQKRIALLEGNILANTEAAARHRKAIQLLEKHDAACLGELPVEDEEGTE